MNRSVLQFLTVFFLLINSSMLSATAITYSDSTFLDSNWAHQVLLDETPGGGSFSAGQATAGGNPGAYQEGNHTYGPGLVVFGHLFNGGGSYDPATHGAIDSIDFSHDFIVLTLRYRDSTDVAASLLVEQGGRYFSGQDETKSFTFGDPWTGASSNLVVSEFMEVTTSGLIAGAPDFSVSGSPLTFGYATLNSTGYSGNTHDWGMENFRVQVNAFSKTNPTPAPATLLLAIIGLGVLGYLRNRIGK